MNTLPLVNIFYEFLLSCYHSRNVDIVVILILHAFHIWEKCMYISAQSVHIISCYQTIIPILTNFLNVIVS